MVVFPDVLWLNVSPAFQRFHRPFLQQLAQQRTVGSWDYTQELDEPLSLTIALNLLHDYLKSCDRPLHLMGHSTSGLLGLLYARQHPERVQSLTLLSVGVHPAVNWHAHYYAQAQFLRCSRYMLLAQMTYNLFGYKPRSQTQAMIKVLEQDLATSLSPHTLCKTVSIPPGGVSVPLMVCGGADDIIIDPNLLQGWKDWMKPQDRLWLCPESEHFFHADEPELAIAQITNFWESLSISSEPPQEVSSPASIDRVCSEL